METKELEIQEKKFFETNVEGHWTHNVVLLCSEELKCSEYLKCSE